MAGKKKKPEPKEEDYEWIFIEEDLLEDDESYFDLNMMVLVTEPDTTTLEGEPDNTTIEFVEIPL